MKDRNTEMLNLRITSRRKKWLQKLAVNSGLSMGQWVQVQVIKCIAKAIDAGKIKDTDFQGIEKELINMNPLLVLHENLLNIV